MLCFLVVHDAARYILDNVLALHAAPELTALARLATEGAEQRLAATRP